MAFALGAVDLASKSVDSVTSVNLGFEPSCVIFLPRVNTTGAGGSTGATFYGLQIGALTPDGQLALHAMRPASADADRRHQTGIVHDGTANPGGGIFTGELTGDGFELTCTDESANNNYLPYFAIGGSGVQAKVGTLTAPNGAGATDINVGFRPHLVLAWSLGTLDNDSDTSSDLCAMGVCAHDLSQGAYSSRAASGTGAKLHYNAVGEAFALAHASANEIACRGAVTAWRDDGFRVQWSAAAGEKWHYLAIRGVDSRIVSLAAAETLNEAVTVALPWSPESGLSFGHLDGTLNALGAPSVTSGTGGHRALSLGAWAGSSQHAFSLIYQRTSSSDSQAIRYGSSFLAGRPSVASSLDRDRYAVDAIGPNNLTIRTIEADIDPARTLMLLALNASAPIDPEPVVLPPPEPIAEGRIWSQSDLNAMTRNYGPNWLATKLAANRCRLDPIEHGRFRVTRSN